MNINRHSRFAMNIKVLLIVVSLIFSTLTMGYHSRTAAALDESETVDEILLQTGMPSEQIALLDNLTKRFIVNDLQSQDSYEPFYYIGTTTQTTEASTRVTEVFNDIKFSATAFRSGNQISIYPVYEFTKHLQPKGNDSFSLALGDAVSTYDFGGKTWYQDPWSTTWKDGHTSLSTNREGLNYAEFAGNQLGNSTGPLKYRGNIYIHATATGKTDKRIVMNYLYNPNRVSYSLSINIGNLGISFNVPSGTAYSKGSTITLNF